MATPLVGGHKETVLCVAVTADDSGCIVSGGEDGELCLWTLGGSLIKSLCLEDKSDVTSLCCSQQRPCVIYASADNQILGFDTRQLDRPFHTFSCNDEEISQIVMNEKEEYLAACDDSGAIKIVDLHHRRVYKTLRKHTNICATIAFRPKRQWELFSGGYDSKLIQWDFSRGRGVCVINMEEIGASSSNEGAYLVNPPFVHSISISRNGQFLACGTEKAQVQLFRSEKRNPEYAQTLHGHTHGVSQVHFPDFTDDHLITGSNDGKVLIWDVSSLQPGGELSNGGPLLNGHAAHQNGAGGENQNGESSDSDSALAEQATMASLRPKVTIDHGAKVNWLASGHRANQKFIIVADNTENLMLYPFPE